MHFQCNRCVLNRSRNISNNVGNDRSKDSKMFSKSKLGAGAILNCGYLAFSTSSMCSRSKYSNISTKFGDRSREMNS